MQQPVANNIPATKWLALALLLYFICFHDTSDLMVGCFVVVSPHLQSPPPCPSQLQRTKLLNGPGDVESGPGTAIPQKKWLHFISPIFVQAFTLTFLAEWGDRSQLTTIVLAAREVSVAECLLFFYPLWVACRGVGEAKYFCKSYHIDTCCLAMP